MKAQLILVGGRASIPNILTIIYQRPDVVIPVCSIESKRDLPALQQAIRTVHPACRIEEIDPVDACSFSQIYDVCEKAVISYPNAEWIFNITMGTSIMSIGAYEVAKKYQSSRSVQCWYINTSQARVISLPEDASNSSYGKEIFKIEVSQYAAAYNRVLLPGDLEDERAYAEQHWLPFAQRLGKNPHDAFLIKLMLSKIGDNKPRKDRDGKDGSKYPTIKGLSDEVYHLLEGAQSLQLVSQLRKDADSISFRLSYPQHKFLNGAWLEMYVWDEANKLGIFDDCQWNHTIVDGKSNNELDVTMTYKAQLLIAECKTGEEAFDSDTLYKSDSVANLLGGRFVGRLLITSLPLPKDHQKFLEQANSRRIVVVTAEDLSIVGAKISEEAKQPRYARM